MEHLFSGTPDPGLTAYCFTFSRFLMNTSSRRCELHANLQDIWNEHFPPACQSDLHLNLNLQMNYQPNQGCSLPETRDLYIRLLEPFRPSSK